MTNQRAPLPAVEGRPWKWADGPFPPDPTVAFLKAAALFADRLG